MKPQVAVDSAYRRALPATLVRSWAETALRQLALPDTATVSIVITGDEEVRRLNRRYRGEDTPTDVLSFPFTGLATPAPYYGETPPEHSAADAFVLPPAETGLLGELVIAFPYARRQAEAAGHSPQAEVALLLVHGLLHLLGYDHDQPDRRHQMWTKTHELLAVIQPGVRYILPGEAFGSEEVRT